MSESTSSRLSVLCVTPDRLETLFPLFRALAAQTIANQIEIVVLAPAAVMHDPLPFAETIFFRVTRHLAAAHLTNPQLRAAAVRLATSQYIVFTEDHCFPEQQWAAALVAALDTGALGAGPVMISANTDSSVSQANFLLEYGEWSHAGAAGTVRHLPGHNSAYHRDRLVALGDRLEAVLELESPWLWEESASGAKLLCVAGARSHHFNFSTLRSSLPLRFHGGRVFGANRARSWSMVKRVMWACALPLIVAVRWRRSLAQATKFMPGQPLVFHLVLPTLLTADSIGEVAGYLTGSGQAIARVSGLEFHRGRFTNGVPVRPPFLDS